jgi:hypothetical protein
MSDERIEAAKAERIVLMLLKAEAERRIIARALDILLAGEERTGMAAGVREELQRICGPRAAWRPVELEELEP